LQGISLNLNQYKAFVAAMPLIESALAEKVQAAEPDDEDDAVAEETGELVAGGEEEDED
jgi:hypothetical protein